MRKISLLLTLSLVAGACTDAPTATLESSRAAPGSVALRTPSQAQVVAQGLALAMRDESIREQVHGAMRASLLNEHKLVLQDFLNTPAGQKLVAAAAAGLNLTSGAFNGAATSLPKLDLYVPFEAHRLTWKPTSDVYVATTFDPNAATITAYGTNGQTVALRRDAGVPEIPLIILHPAEPKTLRDRPQADLPGDVIQDRTDGGLSSTSVRLSPSDPSFLVEDPGGGGGGGPPPPAPGTYINHFNIQADDGWFGNLEMVFTSVAMVNFQGMIGPEGQYAANDGVCILGQYGQNEVEPYVGYDGLYLISPGITNGTFIQCNGQPAIYGIHIMESDGGANGEDDDFGWRFYTAGPYPRSAHFNPTVESFFENTSNTNLRTAYLRVEIR